MIGLLERLAERPLVAVLRAPTSIRFRDVAAVLFDAGVGAVEVTLTTPGALDTIAELRRRHPDMLVGAGTVRTVEQVDRTVDAGAQFLVSQIGDGELVARARRRDVTFLPGALTPTEIVHAWEMGVEAVKVSPVGPVGGVDYIRELTGPLPDIPLFPTGGVHPADAAAYLDAGARLVGLSGHLLQDGLAPHGDLDALAARTRRTVESLDRRRPARSIP